MKTSWVVVFLFSGFLVAAPPSGAYKSILDKFNSLQAQYPTLSKMITVGTNDDSVDIYAMRISLTPESMDPRKSDTLWLPHTTEMKRPARLLR